LAWQFSFQCQLKEMRVFREGCMLVLFCCVCFVVCLVVLVVVCVVLVGFVLFMFVLVLSFLSFVVVMFFLELPSFLRCAACSVPVSGCEKLAMTRDF
jgi:hypothetical protein